MAVLTGRLVDEDGRPVAGGTVYFISGPVSLPDIAQVAGADGEFVLSVPVKGRYRIGARASGFAPGEAEVDVSGDDARVEVILKRAPDVHM